MASWNQKLDVPDMYNCTVCMEHLNNRNPRYLTCYHYFCEQCLQKLVRNNRISCPSCRKVTEVPNNDVTSLQVNYLLVQMLERELQFGPPKGTCITCKLCNVADAVCKCCDCSKFLCGGCRDKHNKLQKFKHHITQPLDALCKKHSDVINHICMKCCKEICEECIILEHGDHEGEVISHDDGMKKIKDEITHISNTLQSIMDGAGEKKQKLYTDSKQFIDEIGNLQKENELLNMKIKQNMEMMETLKTKKEQVEINILEVDKEYKEYGSFLELIVKLKQSSNKDLMQEYGFIKHKSGDLKLDTYDFQKMKTEKKFPTSKKQAARKTLSGPELAARMKKGTHVVRGKDWKPDYKDQDGPPPGLGTLTSNIYKDGSVCVQWENGMIFGYRMGYDGKYDLKLADSEL